MEMKHLALNAKKAMQSLGWRPRLDTRRTIDWTIDWYRRFDAGENPRALTMEQIGRYEALASEVPGVKDLPGPAGETGLHGS